MRKVLLVFLLVGLLVSMDIMPAFGAEYQEVIVTASPRFISITNTPSSWDAGVVATNTTYDSGLSYFEVTNNSVVPVDIDISGTNMTGGGYTWELSDTATPDDMVYGLEAGLSGTLEDFTTYTKVDPNVNIWLVGTNHIDFLAYAGEDAYLYKDKGIAHFGDFEHKIDVKLVSKSGTFCFGYPYVLSNDIDDARGLLTTGKTSINIQLEAYPGIFWLMLEETYSGENYLSEIEYATSYPTAWYYLTIKKVGTVLTCKIYSDSARTTLLDTLNLTLHADHKFRYIFAANTHNINKNDYEDLDIENLDLHGYDTIVKKNSPYNKLVSDLAVNATQGWGLKLYAPTGYDDGNTKLGTVTVTASG